MPFQLFSQTKHCQDTLLVFKEKPVYLSPYLSFYIDSTNQLSIKQVTEKNDLGAFKCLTLPINFGLNPYNLWIKLNAKHQQDFMQNYWWSIYSQADTLMVYEKIKDNQYVCTDTLTYLAAQANKELKVRFLAVPLTFKANESKTLFLKVTNLRYTQYFTTDFTTPVINLMWEKDFYWINGIFAGGFLLVILMNFIVFIVTKEKIFIYYSFYVLTVLFLMLTQELLGSVLPQELYNVFLRIHPMLVVIIGLSVYYFIISNLIKINHKENIVFNIVYNINRAGLFYALITAFIYFIAYEEFNNRTLLYIYVWWFNVALIIIMLAALFVGIMMLTNSARNGVIYLLVATFLVYFNPASYYLNYEGVIDYYEITYPNYFYWVVCIEFLILGGFLAWNYRKKSFQNNKLMQEKKEFSQKIIIAELNAKEKERKQITRNLHDELGATLSALNLVITNNYSDDKYLANTIEKANTDLRYFYSQLSEDVTQGDGVFAFIKLKEEEINQSLPIKFTSFLDGDDATLPSDMVFNLKKIIAELINNSLKHAKCTEITIQLIIENQQLQLIFEDNGVGYNSLKQHEGMGLNNIYHRVDSLNGDIHVSSDKKGTTTIITFIF